MKIDAAYSTQTTFEQTPVGFDEESVGLMADILSGLYTNPNEAVIREYTANGLDAQDDAGVDSRQNPVEVRLPEPFEPYLVISDQGTGMTKYQAERLFAHYVSSNKRHSNDAIGGFGIGSMSAFAVADLMMVTTVFDGKKTDLTVIRTDKGPQITESTTVTESTLPNGTTVTIPVDPHQDWETHAVGALSYCAGRVSIDGEQLSDPRGENPSMITGLSGYQHRKRDDRLVMGGMNYRIPESVMDKVRTVVVPMYGSRLDVWVIEVPIGTVRLAYDRESIMDTTSNAQALADYIEAHYVEPMRAQFVGRTEWEAVRKMLDASAAFIPAEALAQVKSVSSTMAHGARHETYLGFEVIDDTRRKIDGAYSNLFSAVVSSASVMFFPWENTRSPKVRRWLIDHERAAGPAVAVAVGGQEKLDEIAEAGFTVMDADALKSYEPVIKSVVTPRAKNTGYLVVDPATGEETMAEPSEIAEGYDAMVFGREYSRDYHHYHARSRDVETVTAAWPHERVAIVRTTTNQRYETAQKRIGLPVRRMDDARLQTAEKVWAMVTEHEKSLLAAVFSDGYMPSGIGELTVDHQLLADAVYRPKKIMEVAERIGSAVTIDLSQAQATLDSLDDERTFEALRQRVAEAGLDPARWIEEALRAHREELDGIESWGKEVQFLVKAMGRVYGDHHVEAMIAGYLVLGIPETDD